MSQVAQGLAMLLLLTTGCAFKDQHRPLELVGAPDLVYPPAAMAAGTEGHVVVRYDVTVDGRVRDPVVIESEPQGLFDDAALAAVRNWRFKPPLRNGQPIPRTDVESTVRFLLQSGGGRDYQLPVPGVR